MKYEVVIPLYQKAPHITRTLESVLSQTMTDFGIIIVDDASTDDGARIARDFLEARAYGNYRILRRETPQSGGYAARNYGVSSSAADWVAFIDADDVWEPWFLEEVDNLRRDFPEVAFVSTAFSTVYDDGSSLLNPFARKHSRMGRKRIGFHDFVTYCARSEWPVQTSASAMQRSALLEAGGFPEGKCKRGGDRETWLRMAFAVPYAWSSRPCAIYHKDSQNMVTKTIAHSAPYIAVTIRSMVDTMRMNRGTRYQLKKLHNIYHSHYHNALIKQGRFLMSDISMLYPMTTPFYSLKIILKAIKARVLRGPYGRR